MLRKNLKLILYITKAPFLNSNDLTFFLDPLNFKDTAFKI